MRLTDIYLQKIRAVFVISVEFYQVADPATEGRSSVAAENQDQRFDSDAIAQLKSGCAIEGVEFRVAGAVAHMEIAAVHVGQGITDQAVNVGGPTRHHTEEYEGDGQEYDHST